MTGPWVCIEEYGTTFISVFMWELEGAEEFFEADRWYHPPGEFLLFSVFGEGYSSS